MLKALPAQHHLQQTLYSEQQKPEPSLLHQGNNCFFNSTISYFNGILQEQHLDAIDRDHFHAATRLYRPTDITALKARCRSQHKKFRTAFTRLMRVITLSRKGGATSTDVEKLTQEFYQSARRFSGLPGAYNFQNILSACTMAALRQEDPDELINAISTTLGLDLAPERSLVAGIIQTFTINNSFYRRTSWEGTTGGCIRIELPSPEHIEHLKIRSFDHLINRHYLASEQISAADKYYLSPRAAAGMGVTDRDILKHGRYMMPSQSLVFGHHNPDAFRHLSVQAKVFRHIDNLGGKIRGVTRRLLAGGDTINLPVTHLGNMSQQNICMRLDSVIMHRGDDTSSGHYVTAVRRGDGWYIHDDVAPTTIKLVPRGQVGTPDLELLLSYMEQHRLDPYLFHFSR